MSLYDRYFKELLINIYNLNKIHDLFYPIIMILRQEKNGDFNYRLEDKDVVIQTPANEELLRVRASVFLEKAEDLLQTINKGNGAFAIPQIEAFMNDIHCHSLKAKSSDKTDIKIILHDRRTKINSEMGFSIKSQLGGNSTLLNAGKTTNFNFKIKGAEFSNQDISEINSLEPKRNKVIERVNAQNWSLTKWTILHFATILLCWMEIYLLL